MISLGSMSPSLWTWVQPHTVAFVYCAFMTVLLAGFLTGEGQSATFSNKVLPRRYTFSLTNSGRISSIDSETPPLSSHCSSAPMQIHSSSQVFPWGICLEVVSVKRRWFDKDHSHLAWVLKNECSEADYRRLARAVIFASKGTSSRN